MRIITTDEAGMYIREHGGKVWVWLDPHRGIVGSHVWLEAHCEPPGTSRRTKFTRSSRRPHRFQTVNEEGIEVHYAFGRMEPPDELHFDRKGWRRRSHRLEAYWNGSVFVDDQPMPGPPESHEVEAPAPAWRARGRGCGHQRMPQRRPFEDVVSE